MTATMSSSARPAGAGSHPRGRVTLEGLVQALGPEMNVPGPSLLYRLAMVVVMLFMLMLPVVYMGIIVLLGYGVYQYATHASVLFDNAKGRAIILVLLMYLAPIIAGVTVIFFMLKPFFARTVDNGVPLSVTQQEQPVLFAVVRRLCEIVGSPMPSRIDLDCRLNASAGPRRGLLSVMRGDLVLCIGLPLVSTMNLAQLCGVLAHEFGHFRQMGAMTQIQIIRRLHYWVDSAVYKRDNWDQWLEQATAQSPYLPLTLLLLFVRLMVWVSRRVLWVMSFLSGLISGFMLRQMEYDADRIAKLLVGHEVAGALLARLNVLGAVESMVWEGQQEYWRQGNVSDNIPYVIASRTKKIPRDEFAKLELEFLDKERAGWFSSHPTMRRRIGMMRQAPAPAVFTLDLPASVLFRDYEKLCKIVSAMAYQGMMGPAYERMQIIDTRELEEKADSRNKLCNQMDDYMRRGVFYRYPRWLTLESPVFKPVDKDKAIEGLKQARALMLNMTPAIQEQASKLDSMSLLYHQAAMRAIAHNEAFVAPDHPRVTPRNKAEIQQKLTSLLQSEKAVCDAMAKPWQVMEYRMTLAFRLLQQGRELGIANASDKVEQVKSLREVLAVIRELHPRLIGMYETHYVIMGIISGITNEQAGERCAPLINRYKDDLYSDLQYIQRAIRHVELPYIDSGGATSLSKLVMPEPVNPLDLASILNGTPEVFNMLMKAYRDVLAHMAAIAIEVESTVGLEPLPAMEEPAVAHA